MFGHVFESRHLVSSFIHQSNSRWLFLSACLCIFRSAIQWVHFAVLMSVPASLRNPCTRQYFRRYSRQSVSALSIVVSIWQHTSVCPSARLNPTSVIKPPFTHGGWPLQSGFPKKRLDNTTRSVFQFCGVLILLSPPPRPRPRRRIHHFYVHCSSTNDVRYTTCILHFFVYCVRFP